MQKTFFTLLCIVYIVSVQAQIRPLIQFQASPLALNPALAGMENATRINFTGEKNWGNVYNNSYIGNNVLSVDRAFGVGRNDRIGAGIIVNYDLNSSTVRYKGGYFLGSYQMKMAESSNQVHYASAGFKFGQIYQSLDDIIVMTGEEFSDKVFQDFGLGLVWRTTVKNTNSYYEFGFSGGHLNKPNISFLNNSDVRLNRTFQFHLLADIYAGPQIRILPRFRYYARQFTTLRDLTTNFKILFSPDSPNSIEFGGGLLQALGGTDGTASNIIYNLGLNLGSFHIHFGVSIFEQFVFERVGIATLNIGYRFGSKTRNDEN